MGAQGYYADADDNHGLLLLGARYYNPSIGRLITLDPIRDGPNWYVYVGNTAGCAGRPRGPELVGGHLAVGRRGAVVSGGPVSHRVDLQRGMRGLQRCATGPEGPGGKQPLR